MVEGLGFLLLLPKCQTVDEFIEMLRRAYGDTFREVDPHGLLGIVALGSDHSSDTHYINIYSVEKQRVVTVFGLRFTHALPIYSRLIFKQDPSPQLLKNLGFSHLVPSLVHGEGMC